MGGPFCVILSTFGNEVLWVSSDPWILGKLHCYRVCAGFEAGRGGGAGDALSCPEGELIFSPKLRTHKNCFRELVYTQVPRVWSESGDLDVKEGSLMLALT